MLAFSTHTLMLTKACAFHLSTCISFLYENNYKHRHLLKGQPLHVLCMMEVCLVASSNYNRSSTHFYWHHYRRGTFDSKYSIPLSLRCKYYCVCVSVVHSGEVRTMHNTCRSNHAHSIIYTVTVTSNTRATNN